MTCDEAIRMSIKYQSSRLRVLIKVMNQHLTVDAFGHMIKEGKVLYDTAEHC